jgi:hypothetical protein
MVCEKYEAYTIFFVFNFFVFYLMTLSVAQTKKRQMIGLLVGNEMERIWKERIISRQ